MKILVVDDDRRLLAAVEQMLVRHGYTVDCAGSADEGVAKVAEAAYDFVLVDYWMPRHDGMWFLRNAALPRTTKTLLVTSFTDCRVIQQMFNGGIVGYLIKPFDEDELIHHLDFHSGATAPARAGADAPHGVTA